MELQQDIQPDSLSSQNPSVASKQGSQYSPLGNISKDDIEDTPCISEKIETESPQHPHAKITVEESQKEKEESQIQRKESKMIKAENQKIILENQTDKEESQMKKEGNRTEKEKKQVEKEKNPIEIDPENSSTSNAVGECSNSGSLRKTIKEPTEVNISPGKHLA